MIYGLLNIKVKGSYSMSTTIYPQNKYLTWHDNIIANAQSLHRKKGKGVYYERHHIIPHSMGGKNDSENLVLLTAKEHFVVHHLLAKMLGGKMSYAFWMMYTSKAGSKTQERYVPSSRVYEEAKKQHSKTLATSRKGKKHSAETKAKMSASMKGIKRSPEACLNISRSKKGITVSPETRAKISAAQKGKIVSDETKAKMIAACKNRSPEEKARISAKVSAARKGVPSRKVTCPHCGLTGGVSNMTRWHFDNCERRQAEKLEAERNKVWKQSPETRAKRAEALKEKPRLTCPQCGKIGGSGGMHRDHFNNCKMKAITSKTLPSYIR